MRAFCLIPIFIALQASAQREPLPFRAQAALPDTAEVLSPADIQISGWLGGRLLANETNRLLTIDTEPLLAGFRHKPGSHPDAGATGGEYQVWLPAQDL